MLSPKLAAQPNPSYPAQCRQDTTSPCSTDYILLLNPDTNAGSSVYFEKEEEKRNTFFKKNRKNCKIVKMKNKKKRGKMEEMPQRSTYLPRRLKKLIFFRRNVVITREAIEAPKNQIFSTQEKKKKKRRHEGEVTLKWALNNPSSPVHRGPKIKFSQKKIVFVTTGTSRRFFAGFGVCSDDWKNQISKKKMKKEKKKKKMKKKMKKQKEK